LKKKLTRKDTKDWNNFTISKKKVFDKDKFIFKKNVSLNLFKTIDLHGFSLDDANKKIDEFIKKCFADKTKKIIVITGKGKRSQIINNPYVSKDLNILKNSVPEFIKSNSNLMKMIKSVEQAKIKDGGSGAFYIFLKNKE
tara:strand:- start:1387 stop:1806 length:420 start_codon:yes stop_codon:yes gene_type:complete